MRVGDRVRGVDFCLQMCLLLRDLLHLLLNVRGGADCMLRGMLGECCLLLRGHSNFSQSLLVLADCLRDARGKFHGKSDRALSELCDDNVDFAFELSLCSSRLRDGMLQSVAVEALEVVKACIKLRDGFLHWRVE